MVEGRPCSSELSQQGGAMMQPWMHFKHCSEKMYTQTPVSLHQLNNRTITARGMLI